MTHDGAGPPDMTPEERTELIRFRLNFMEEELAEFREAWHKDDDAEMFDALLDLVYVAMGTAHWLGYPWQPGWNEVQRANMEKVRGETHRGSSDYDVCKPDGWQPPRLEELLAEYGF